MRRRLAAEALGTFFLLATVVGSGIMAANLSGGNIGVALLANAIATGAILYVLITMFGPMSGAHFNPAVTLAFRIKGEMSTSEALAYLGAQTAGGILGTIFANLMFSLSVVSLSQTARTGSGQWLAEIVATFGLVLTILLTRAARPSAIPTAVALYILAAYWFTSSTSFANPAVTVARMFSDTFAGIAPLNAPLFILCQIVGAALAVWVADALLDDPSDTGRENT